VRDVEHRAVLSELERHDFSLLGGPLHRTAARLGLVRRGSSTVRLGLVLGTVPWLVGVLLTAVEGDVARLFSVEVIGAHVRLLVAIPLLFACESVLDPQLGRFARYCVRSGLLDDDSRTAFAAVLTRTTRWRDHWLPEAVCLALAVLLGIANPATPWGGFTSALGEAGTPSLAGWWYWIVGLTLFRFLLFRWIWRYLLWLHLLWKLSRLPLRLLPAHSDGCGGLGLLADVQAHLLPLVLALAAVLSASFAEDIASGRVSLQALYVAAVAMLLGAALLVVGPLVVFSPALWRCRQQGLVDYSTLAARYAQGFDRKWFGPEGVADDTMLGSPDIQSLADLSTAVGIVRDIRVLPVGRRLLIGIAAATLVPLLPLLSFRYPMATMIDQVLNRLVGL
jgi:hypothetical protein